MTSPATAPAALMPPLAAALAVAAGLQLLRGTLTSLSVYLGQVRDLDPPLLGALILAIFASALAAPLVRRLLSPRRALPALAAAIALLRLAEQFIDHPDAALALGLAGVVSWLWLIPLLLAGDHAPDKRRSRVPPIMVLLLGLTIDTALKGAFGTLDLSAAPGWPPRIATIALTAVQLGLLLRLARIPAAGKVAAAPPVSSYAVGPAFAMQLLVFQNIAHHTALIGWTTPAVFAWTLGANLIAIWAAAELTQRGTVVPRWLSVVAAAMLLASAAPDLPPPLAAAAAAVGPVVIAVLLAQALAASRQTRHGWHAAALGLLAVPVVLFGWYARYEVDLPIPQAALPLAAAALVAAPALSGGGRSIEIERRLPRAALLPVLLLGLLPLHQFLVWDPPRPPPADTAPLRVMTYNIHQGADLFSKPDLEAIAAVIEAEQPQIAALQEVPRGWVVNGSVDALSWLAQRLQMHAAWGPAADPFWGNAILSRYPIIEAENTPMPNNDQLLLDRAYLTVTVQIEGGPIQVVVTHLHHIGREPHHRLLQIRALLDEIDWNRPTVLLGDLNAQPHHAELRLLHRAGLHSAASPLPTYPAGAPRRQLDHIFVTPHFRIVEIRPVPTTASDHLPLSAGLMRSNTGM